MHIAGVGSKACHCRTCCVTFTAPTPFDHHIVDGVHYPPDERGLVPHQRVWGIAWGRPGRNADDEEDEQTEAVL